MQYTTHNTTHNTQHSSCSVEQSPVQQQNNHEQTGGCVSCKQDTHPPLPPVPRLYINKIPNLTIKSRETRWRVQLRKFYEQPSTLCVVKFLDTLESSHRVSSFRA